MALRLIAAAVLLMATLLPTGAQAQPRTDTELS